jgi:hypothetical protein
VQWRTRKKERRIGRGKKQKDSGGGNTLKGRKESGADLSVGMTRWPDGLMGRGSNLKLIGYSAWAMAPTLSSLSPLHPLYLCHFTVPAPIHSHPFLFSSTLIISSAPLVQSCDIVLFSSVLLNYLLTILVASLFEHSKRIRI